MQNHRKVSVISLVDGAVSRVAFTAILIFWHLAVLVASNYHHSSADSVLDGVIKQIRGFVYL